MIPALEAARDDGRLPNDDAVLSATTSVVEGGPAHGARALDLRVWRGIDLRILPDRGFDIGAAWFAGDPLAWVSAIGETGPLTDLTGLEWSRAFGGGLMVTCGLRNVGMPSEGHGLHGTFSHLAASDIEVTRDFTDGTASTTARAVISDDTGPEPTLRVQRAITTHAGRGRVEVVDAVTNLGSATAAAPILYHFNLGFPLWGPGARLALDVDGTMPRDAASISSLDSWQLPPKPDDGGERVLEHVVVPDDGWGRAEVVNELLEVGLAIEWRAAELPRAHQWIDPSPGMCVLGIEPSNCSTMGRGHDRAEHRLPELAPGETRETALVVEAWSP